MSETIYFVGGSKGGVGKSMVSVALIDHLKNELGKEVHLIETDTSNPDVYKTYRNTVATSLIDIDEADGWVDLTNIAGEFPQRTFVVNSAARSSVGVKRYGAILNRAVDQLGRRLMTLWVINRQKDSLVLLKEYLQTMGKSQTHVLMNTYFGQKAKFGLYKESKVRSEIEKNGGQSLAFPDVADRVADELNEKRMSIEKALVDMPIGNRMELERWRHECSQVFQTLLQ